VLVGCAIERFGFAHFKQEFPVEFRMMCEVPVDPGWRQAASR